jgi:hypothetical protein
MTHLTAAITTAGAAILTTALATLIASIGGVLVGWRASDRADKAHVTAAEVRVLVNGRVTSLEVRTQQLEQALVAAGVPIPADPAVGHAGG